MHAQHEAYAEQERKLGIPREMLQDDRVDAVLYFLPTNARMAESDLDTTVINALAVYAPVIPVMCKVPFLNLHPPFLPHLNTAASGTAAQPLLELLHTVRLPVGGPAETWPRRVPGAPV